MMRKLIIIFFLIIYIDSSAQTVFLPNIGTKWHYVFGQYGPSLNKINAKIEYVKDSIYFGDNIKILNVDKIYSICDPFVVKRVFIKQRNDSVWFLHSKTINTWQLLVNFNATVGQSWNFNIYNSSNILSTYTISVNSVSVVTLNGLTLKSLNVTYKKPNGINPLTYTSTINERLGDTHYLFNMENVPVLYDGCLYVESLLCYEDSTFGFKQFTSNPCDYKFPNPIGLNELKIKNEEFKIYPNPTSEILSIKLEMWNSNENYTIEITNTLGQIVQTSNIQHQTTALNISNLQNGIYFLQVFNNEKLIGTAKILKE